MTLLMFLKKLDVQFQKNVIFIYYYSLLFINFDQTEASSK